MAVTNFGLQKVITRPVSASTYLYILTLGLELLQIQYLTVSRLVLEMAASLISCNFFPTIKSWLH